MRLHKGESHPTCNKKNKFLIVFGIFKLKSFCSGDFKGFFIIGSGEIFPVLILATLAVKIPIL